MTSVLFLFVLIFICTAAVFLQRRQDAPLPCFTFLTFVLPFAAGGFHGYTIAVCNVVILLFLFLRIRKTKQLSFTVSLSSIAVLSLFLGSCLTPLWAADKGMAPFGILRCTAVLLYMLYLMQCSAEEQAHALDLVPLSGAVMTVAATILLLIPETKAAVTVNGRLAGFFQYPNTFAAYLLAGTILLQHQDRKSIFSHSIHATLLAGIVLSGSRTVFILLLTAIAGSLFAKKDCRNRLLSILSLVPALLLGLLFSRLGLLEHADRYTGISPATGTFLVRLLYYKDALKLVAANPFGLGYLGYRALEGSIQTGRYYVTYVHNGLLQLLLDYGWVPAILTTAAFLRTLFSKRVSAWNKLLPALLLAHCLLDYDLEFLSIWVLLLSMMDFRKGRNFCLSFHRVLLVPGLCLMLLSIWLGVSEWSYHTGRTDLCLRLTPFHTDALAYQLSRQETPLQAEPLADRILQNQPRHPLALTAKADAAFYRGDIPSMMNYKEQAIACDRYDTDSYCDYINKLYAAIQISLQSGDHASANACASKILDIPDMMQLVSQSTDPLAYQTGDDPSMVLPEEYQLLISALKQTS